MLALVLVVPHRPAQPREPALENLGRPLHAIEQSAVAEESGDVRWVLLLVSHELERDAPERSDGDEGEEGRVEYGVHGDVVGLLRVVVDGVIHLRVCISGKGEGNIRVCVHPVGTYSKTKGSRIDTYLQLRLCVVNAHLAPFVAKGASDVIDVAGRPSSALLRERRMEDHDGPTVDEEPDLAAEDELDLFGEVCEEVAEHFLGEGHFIVRRWRRDKRHGCVSGEHGGKRSTRDRKSVV